MPWAAKVLGSSLTRTCVFFSKRKFFSLKKLTAIFFVCVFVVGLVVTSWNCFFSMRFS